MKKAAIKFIKLIPCLFVFIASATVTFAQEIEYTIKGRVVDENGIPQSRASVKVSAPLANYADWVSTDENGRFTITQKEDKGIIRYLFTGDGHTYSKTGVSLLNESLFSPGKELFKALPIEFGDNQSIDSGDVPVQWWEVDVNVRIRKKGRNLTKKQWLWLWCRLKDGSGRILIETNLGATIEDNEVDLRNSILKLSLPEGRWKLEFQNYDEEQNKIYPEILGQTPYFTVSRKMNIQTVDVTF
jgi:hypothetical protein